MILTLPGLILNRQIANFLCHQLQYRASRMLTAKQQYCILESVMTQRIVKHMFLDEKLKVHNFGKSQAYVLPMICCLPKFLNCHPSFWMNKFGRFSTRLQVLQFLFFCLLLFNIFWTVLYINIFFLWTLPLQL